MRSHTSDAPLLVIDALSARAGGGLSVARDLTDALVEALPDWRLHFLLTNPDSSPTSTNERLSISAHPELAPILRRLAWQQHGLARLVRATNARAILQLGGFANLLTSVPQISVWQNAHIWSPSTPGHSLSLRFYIQVQRLLMRLALRKSEVHVFLSEHSRKASGDRFGGISDNWHVIPLGLNARFFASAPPPLSSRRSIVLAVGDLYPHKRVELLIDAIARLEESHGDLELNIAGRPVDGDYAGRLERQIRERGLEGRVRLLGQIEGSRLMDLYDASRAFASASGLETFGLTPLEAMARGLPVLAIAGTTAEELCGDVASYSPPDPAALADQLRLLLDDLSLAEQRSTQGRIKAREYQWARIGRCYAALIESLAQRSGER